MSTKSIEKELAFLKTRLALLEARTGAKPTDWKAAYGALKGQPLHREAAALGAEWRAKENHALLEPNVRCLRCNGRNFV